GRVPVLALERLAVRGIGHAADAEVFLFVVLVDAAETAGHRRAEVRVQAAEEERLIERVGDVGGQRRERSTGTVERDVLFVDLFERAEIEGAVALDRAAE